jgi:hypothetical protein
MKLDANPKKKQAYMIYLNFFYKNPKGIIKKQPISNPQKNPLQTKTMKIY